MPSTSRTIIYVDPENLPEGLAEKNEVVKDLLEGIKKGGRKEENVRLCEGFTCQLPVTTLEDVEKLVE